jgi:hypothetical protein
MRFVSVGARNASLLIDCLLDAIYESGVPGQSFCRVYWKDSRVYKGAHRDGQIGISYGL